MQIDYPEKLDPLFHTNKRYINIYGGRGSGKSHTIATFLLYKSLESNCRILCTREVQNSIKDSVYKLLVDKISQYKWDNHFKIINDSIICLKTGSEFIFKGLRGNAQDIKSTEGLRFAWVEEAQTVSRKSLETLIPTVRAPGSQILFTYNPLTEEDPVHADYTLVDRDDTLKIFINWRDNKWFPEVLRADLEYDKKTSITKYNHIWEGMCVAYENDQIGAFETVPEWKCQYCCAFVDPSFSDRTGTDSTAVAIVGVQDDLLVFTGMLWQKSISNPEVRKELLDFLNIYTPIESVLESQLSDSSIFILDILKSEETYYDVKNLWTIKHQHRAKHERIMSTVGVQKKNLRILQGTQQAFSLEVSRYRKDAPHDDACMVWNTQITTLSGKKNIRDIKKGEMVLSPFGFSKVLNSGYTGEKEIINKLGLNITRNHKVYNKIKNEFTVIDSLTGKTECEILSIRGLIKWAMIKQLYLTDANIQNRETIISLAKLQMKNGGIVNSCIRQFGNFIIKKKFQTAFMFIIKILTQITTILLIWNYLQFMNIYRCMVKITLRKKDLEKAIKRYWIKYGIKQKNGTQVQKGMNGIKNMLRIHFLRHGNLEKKESVLSAAIGILQKLKGKQNTVQVSVVNKTDQKEITKEKVYNLTVECGMYYANKILVSNCDSLAGAIEALGTSSIVAEYAKAVEIMRRK